MKFKWNQYFNVSHSKTFSFSTTWNRIEICFEEEKEKKEKKITMKEEELVKTETNGLEMRERRRIWTRSIKRIEKRIRREDENRNDFEKGVRKRTRFATRLKLKGYFGNIAFGVLRLVNVDSDRYCDPSGGKTFTFLFVSFCYFDYHELQSSFLIGW